jgi:hypothetical protein
MERLLAEGNTSDKDQNDHVQKRQIKKKKLYSDEEEVII